MTFVYKGKVILLYSYMVLTECIFMHVYSELIALRSYKCIQIGLPYDELMSFVKFSTCSTGIFHTNKYAVWGRNFPNLYFICFIILDMAARKVSGLLTTHNAIPCGTNKDKKGKRHHNTCIQISCLERTIEQRLPLHQTRWCYHSFTD